MANGICKASLIPNTISTSQAAREICSSVNFILSVIRSSELPAIKVLQKTRSVWRIDKNVFADFVIKLKTDRSRIGRINRGLLLPHNRAPILLKGYRYLWNPEHHRAQHDGYVAEHIVVAEKKLKRKILKGEHVHHINGVKDDNRPENLKVYKSQSHHMKKAHGVSAAIRLKFTYMATVGKESLLALSDADKILLFNQLCEML